MMIPQTLLPEGVRYFIAGGWAACPALASDKDVWVRCSRLTPETLPAFRQTLLDHLQQQNFIYDEEVDRRTFDQYGGDGKAVVVKVAKVYVGGSHSIHLLLTNAEHIDDVLNSFDVSTHAVAIDDRGQLVLGQNWTPINEPPLKLKETPTTDARMEKIRQRYAVVGMETSCES